MKFENLKWINEPRVYEIKDDGITIQTQAHTDFWQRTYYGFQNDNAPALLCEVEKKRFTFQFKVEFDSKHRYDQCGVMIYQDGENWLKASIEYENEEFQRLGSVVTNNGYSDWATTDIAATQKFMHYRLSRRENDFLVENSLDGINYKQMRIFHMFKADDIINVGIYACSPEDSSFNAKFSEIKFIECVWQDHDGQEPD